MENTENVHAPTPEPTNVVEFNEALRKYVAHVQEIVNNDFSTNSPSLPVPSVVFDANSRYVAIRTKVGETETIHSFVDQKGGKTSKVGDVLRAASAKAPAVHARGNIFDGSYVGNVTSTGTSTLKPGRKPGTKNP